MTTIYVIMQTVDLGGSIVQAYYNKAKAESKMLELNTTYRDDKIKSLVKNCGDTQEEAELWYGDHTEFYIEEVTIE